MHAHVLSHDRRHVHTHAHTVYNSIAVLILFSGLGIFSVPDLIAGAKPDDMAVVSGTFCPSELSHVVCLFAVGLSPGNSRTRLK